MPAYSAVNYHTLGTSYPRDGLRVPYGARRRRGMNFLLPAELGGAGRIEFTMPRSRVEFTIPTALLAFTLPKTVEDYTEVHQ